MDFNEYQKKARKTAVYPDLGNNLWYPALGLGESGECQNIVKKVYRDKDGIPDINDVRSIIKELGDQLWYVAALASELDVPLDDIARLNIEKLSDRQERGVINGSGDNR